MVTGGLIGNAEAHLALEGLPPGKVNVSCAVFPARRGQGIAARAVMLICGWLQTSPQYTTAVLRIEPGNVHSHRVPVAAGFVKTRSLIDANGQTLIRYEKSLCRTG